MDHYLDAGEGGLSGQELHDAFEQCLREGHLVPVCFVSARSGAGMHELLDIAGKLLPHPGEANPPPFVKGRGDDATPIDRDARSEGACDRRRLQDRQRSVRRQARRFPRLPGHGAQGHAAVHRRRQEAVQGRATCSSSRARTTSRSTQAIPGDIAAVAKIDELHFDAVLHDSHDEDQIHLAPLAFPEADVRPCGRGRAQGPGTEARPPRCTSWPKKIRLSPSSTTWSSTRRSARAVRPAPARDARAA